MRNIVLLNADSGRDATSQQDQAARFAPAIKESRPPGVMHALPRSRDTPGVAFVRVVARAITHIHLAFVQD